jgi:FlaA1/EpsC-like NDP-sugar epimerase
MTSLGLSVLEAVLLVFTLGWVVMTVGSIPFPSRMFPVIFTLLVLVGCGAPRAGLRILQSQRKRYRHDYSFWHVLIMGAGEAGALTALEIQHNPQLGLEVVGFVDDDPAKRGMRIHDIPVLGNRNDIPELARAYSLRQVIIALPSVPGSVIRDITRICENVAVSARIMPGLYELLDGKVSVNRLRKVEIEDLLRRDTIQTDINAVQALVRGKRVLITGGGGSIGSELCRQVLKCAPA